MQELTEWRHTGGGRVQPPSIGADKNGETLKVKKLKKEAVVVGVLLACWYDFCTCSSHLLTPNVRLLELKQYKYKRHSLAL